MNIDEIRILIQTDMDAVNQLIHGQLYSEVALINQLSTYIVKSGGKRLRPVIVLLASRACHYQGNHHICAAAIIEFIHTITNR